MRYLLKVLYPAVALAALAGCASAPPPAVAVVPKQGPIAVSCTEDAISDTPCLAAARRDCPRATVDTIHLVLAKPDADKASYEYRATYFCPSTSEALALPK
ncbi:hypothetical protein [Luteibacter aegosomatissinici]|uniref:hypothetical protein n=1 Tax=Luteibacter aegosomatissinici TaxID=2911539 RepID=UPI001FF75CFD|nr:hypothetical protein [Luteibacter aegosomatissinici]UPG94480.1 hypothetical protein L2Y97_22120 [Luteibacter aegosomatissinici]